MKTIIITTQTLLLCILLAGCRDIQNYTSHSCWQLGKGDVHGDSRLFEYFSFPPGAQWVYERSDTTAQETLTVTSWNRVERNRNNDTGGSERCNCYIEYETRLSRNGAGIEESWVFTNKCYSGGFYLYNKYVNWSYFGINDRDTVIPEFEVRNEQYRDVMFKVAVIDSHHYAAYFAPEIGLIQYEEDSVVWRLIR